MTPFYRPTETKDFSYIRYQGSGDYNSTSEPYITADDHTCRLSVDITPLMKQLIGGSIEEFTADIKGLEEKICAMYEAIEEFNEKYKIQIELSIEADMKMDKD